MRPLSVIKTFLSVATFFLVLSPLQAATQPKFTITPITATHFNLFSHQIVTAQYTVTNKTKITRTLTMVPIAQGIKQTSDKPGDCANPFTLSQNQSCTLTIEIDGSYLSEQDIKTPIKVCLKNQNSNTPDLFLCSQTDSKDNLTIINLADISASPHRLHLGPSTTGTVSVRNNSNTIFAHDIKAYIDEAGLSDFVSYTKGANCAILPPQQTCTLTFTAGATGVSPTPVRIQGKDTNPTPVIVSVAIEALITIEPNFLLLQAGQTGTITVTNHSFLLPANNVTVISPTPLPGGVSVDSCSAGLNGSGSNTCTLTFTAALDAPLTRPTLIQIQGAGTSIAIGELAVNSAPPTLGVSGTPLQLAATTSASGTMMLTNNSLDKPAINVQVYLGTSLSSLVYPSYPGGGTACPTIPHGGTCTITFSPSGASVSPLQTFSFYGDNTETSTGQISLGSYLLYVTEISTSSIVASSIGTSGYLSGSPSTIVSAAYSYLYGVAMNNPTTTAYYLRNNNPSTPQTTVISCSVNETTGLFSCTNSTSFYTSSSEEYSYHSNQIAYNSTSIPHVLYISNQNNLVTTCSLSDDDSINSSTSSCANTTLQGVSVPNGVAFNPVNSTLFVSGGAYIVGGTVCPPLSSGETVTQYSVTTSSGSITSSYQNRMTMNGIVPAGLAVDTSGDYVYIASECSLGVYGCPLAGGLLPTDITSCTPNSLSGCSGTYTLSIALNDSNNLAYITTNGTYLDPTNPTASVCQCNFSSGTLSNCVPQSYTSSAEVYGVALYPSP